MLNIFTASFARLIPSTLKASHSNPALTQVFNPDTATAEDWIEHLAQLKHQVEQKHNITIYVPQLPIDILHHGDHYSFGIVPEDVTTLTYFPATNPDRNTLILEGHSTASLRRVYLELLDGRGRRLLEQLPCLSRDEVYEIYQVERDQCFDSLSSTLEMIGMPLSR